MKISIVLFLSSLLMWGSMISCKIKKDDPHSFSFNEKDYKLINTTKDDLGNKYLEEYINIKDSNERLKKIFWENGNIQSVIFFKGSMQNGPNDYYDSNGDLLYSGFYYQDKETGITILYNKELQKARIRTCSQGNVMHEEEANN